MLSLALGESQAESRVFGATYGITGTHGGEQRAALAWVCSAEQGEESERGFYVPFTARVAGIAVGEDYGIEWFDGQTTYGLEKHGDWWYLEGASLKIAVWQQDPVDEERGRLVYYVLDDRGRATEVRVRRETSRIPLRVAFKDLRKTSKWLASRGIWLLIVDVDVQELSEQEEAKTPGRLIAENNDYDEDPIRRRNADNADSDMKRVDNTLYLDHEMVSLSHVGVSLPQALLRRFAKAAIIRFEQEPSSEGLGWVRVFAV